MALLAALLLAGFRILSIFSGQIIHSEGLVRVRSDICGWPAEIGDLWNTADADAKQVSAALLSSARATLKTARNQAMSCYARSDTEHSDLCRPFKQPRIASRLSFESCPFSGGVCKTGAARIESEPIDSREVLGINTLDKDRIVARKVMTCVPIDVDRWATPWVDGQQYGFTTMTGDQAKGYEVGIVPSLDPPLSMYPLLTTNYSIMFASDHFILK